MSEICQKCGEEGEDRRTLWMSCFYAMDEMKEVPFKQKMVKGKVHEYKGERPLGEPFHGHTVPEFKKKSNGKSGEHRFFTLRVCKTCRADWMAAIRTWFLTPSEPAESCGSGIFVRELGKLVELTPEEWAARR